MPKYEKIAERALNIHSTIPFTIRADAYHNGPLCIFTVTVILPTLQILDASHLLYQVSIYHPSERIIMHPSFAIEFTFPNFRSFGNLNVSNLLFFYISAYLFVQLLVCEKLPTFVLIPFGL